MAPLEPWEKVLVDGETFPQSAHGKKSCTDCHSGTQSSDKEAAHEGLIASPSQQPEKFCAECHADQTSTYANSLHNTQAGYWTTINARSVPENHPALEEMFGNHCATCHTTCGECHVTQPKNVGGGLFSGHLFEKTPPMTRSCTACHGSRVGNEFLGKNEEFPGDVHFREARMSCVKCHEGTDLHGSAEGAPEHRLAGAEDPTCLDCHPTAAPGGDTSPMHQAHGDTLSCQVCHSITYTSCDGCHVAVSESSGNPYFETQATYMTFLIGRNPDPSEERPYKYVPVRHVPVAETSYQFYGENLLSNFNALPTWVYATPHNIQRSTPQNSACENCHSGSADLFLTADKIKPEELEANGPVVVDVMPVSMDVILSAPDMPAGHKTFAPDACATCHATTGGSMPVIPENHAAYSPNQCQVCHKLPE
ncbi:MAG TPA: ammonia-forming cytochrome c nitrite reductase subunit c552 [Anaerolineales bacterium]|nr:ammonia-forming cytochrome c nitrite reductase subunit c552 [Anaerolineales bacterium]